MKSNIFQLSHRIKSIIEASCTNNRGRYRTAATSKMELFVIIVNGFQSLTIITKCSILDVAAVLDPPLNNTHWRKGFLQLPLLKVCGSFLFWQSQKTRGILWSIQVIFAFPEGRRQNKYCLWEANLVFYVQIIGFMRQSVNLL